MTLPPPDTAAITANVCANRVPCMQTVLADTASISPNEGKVGSLSKQPSLQRKDRDRMPVLQPPLALGVHQSRGLGTLNSFPSSHNLEKQPSFAFESTSLSGRNCTHVAQLGQSSQIQQPDATAMDPTHTVHSNGRSEHASSALGRHHVDSDLNSKGCASSFRTLAHVCLACD